MADYIVDADITDNILTSFSTLSDYVTDSDDAVESMAESKGVLDSDDIETDPVHFLVKKYAIAWVGMEMCLDYMGTNNNDLPVEIEKYAVKYKLYKDKIALLDSQITGAMLTGDVDEASDRAIAVRLFRA